jgi:methenyltetrahydromethanopterin cyclohydrolase
MNKKEISVNARAMPLLKKLLYNSEQYRVEIKKFKSGATLIDAGIKAKGGFNAGKIITEICMGGFGKVEISSKNYGGLLLPTVFVYTDHPVLATLGSQFAGWQIKKNNFSAIGSGPARAKALKPKEIYEKIEYSDEKAENAIIILETNMWPPEELLEELANECKTEPKNFFVILTPTTSITGSIQISGRIVETGIHKLSKVGLDPKQILYAYGYAPIAPIHPEFLHAMGRTNDAILYGGFTDYIIAFEGKEEELKEIVEKAPSKASKNYGKIFMEIFKEANYDFYRIDPNLFAPAVIRINNMKTGKIFQAGEINTEMLKHSLLT